MLTQVKCVRVRREKNSDGDRDSKRDKKRKLSK